MNSLQDPTTHVLKTWPTYFHAVKSGKKPFEVRRADREFRVDDILHLKEYDPTLETYTGDEIRRLVTYRLDGPGFGIEEGYCVLGLAKALPALSDEVAP